MTKDQIGEVQSIAFALAGGVGVVYPPAAPLIALIEKFIDEAEAHGIVPAEMSADQAAAIAAGMAAARSSAVTHFKESKKEHGQG